MVDIISRSNRSSTPLCLSSGRSVVRSADDDDVSILTAAKKQTEQRRRGSAAVLSFECKESKASNGKVFSTAVVRSSNSRHFLSLVVAVFGRLSALGAAFDDDDDAIEPVDTCVC